MVHACVRAFVKQHFVDSHSVTTIRLCELTVFFKVTTSGRAVVFMGIDA